MTARLTLQQARRAASSLSWATVDQVFFALSNLVVTLAVARGGGAEGLGRYAVAFAAYLVVLGCARSLISDPLLATPRTSGERSVEGAAASLTGIFALVAALVVAGIGLVLGRPELVVVAAALPLTLLHDVLRYEAFRRQAPAMAALLDGGWLLGSLLAWPVITRSDSAAVAVAAWSAGAVLALLIAAPVIRLRFAGPASSLRWWWSEARTYATPLLLDSVIVASSSQALVVVLASMASDSALGVLRAGQVYFAPMGIGLVAIGVLLVPQLAQRAGATTNTVAIKLSGGIAALAAVFSGAVLVAEPVLHRLLFGSSIDVPRSLLLPLAVGVVVIAASSGFTIVSKARKRSGDIVRSRLSSAAGGVALLVAGVALWGVHGAAWALVVQAVWYTAALGVHVCRAGRALDGAGRDEERSRAAA